MWLVAMHEIFPSAMFACRREAVCAIEKCCLPRISFYFMRAPLANLTHARNQPLPERLEQAPVAPLVGIGQRCARNPAPNTDMVELGALGVQAGHQIAQARTPRQLRVGQAKEVAPGREAAHGVVGQEFLDQVLDVFEGNKVQQLSKDRAAMIHERGCVARKCNSSRFEPPPISNRPTHSSLEILRPIWVTTVHDQI